MARYTNFISGGMASCNINGRNISVINGEVYVDGVHYIHANEAGNEHKPCSPGKIVEHIFDVPSSFTSIVSEGIMGVGFLQSNTDFEVKGMIPENLIERMDVHVEADTLFISMKSGYYDMVITDGNSPTVFVTNKTLKRQIDTLACFAGFTTADRFTG